MDINIFYNRIRQYIINMPKKVIFIGIAVIFFIGLIATGYFFLINHKKPEPKNDLKNISGATEQATNNLTKGMLPSLQTNPLENKPDLNPNNTTNPFRVAKARAVETQSSTSANASPSTSTSAATQSSTQSSDSAPQTNVNETQSAQTQEAQTSIIDTGGDPVEIHLGPGGCQTETICEQYCDEISHINECLSYAEKNDLITPAELVNAKKAQAAYARGIIPPCTGKKCDTYCDENPDQMEKCITFAAQAGILTIPEIEDARKVLEAVKKGIKPPCKGSQCDIFCSELANMETCMNFAIAAGIISESERADAQKVADAIKNGITPPNCSKDCNIYCNQTEHFEECLSFAEKAGMVSPEDAAMARKTGGKGPGGCKGKEECTALCDKPENQQMCLDFQLQYGLMSEEEVKKIQQGREDMRRTLSTSSTEVLNCLKDLLGNDTFLAMQAGNAMPPKDMGDQIQACFAKTPNGGVPTGPGGCSGQAECDAYCTAHPEECGAQGQGPGGPGPGPNPGPGPQTGPGGCQSPEECSAYCSAHPTECQPPPGGPVPCQGENCPPPPSPVSYFINHYLMFLTL